MKLLHISDKELTAVQIKEELNKSGDTKLSYYSCHRTVYAVYNSYSNKNKYNSVLLDLPLKQCSSIESIKFVQRLMGNIPIVVSVNSKETVSCEELIEQGALEVLLRQGGKYLNISLSQSSKQIQTKTRPTEIEFKDKIDTAVAIPPPNKINTSLHQFIGLQNIQDELGINTSKLSSKVLEIAERVVQKELTKDEVYQVVDETDFLVCYSDISEEEAFERGDTISRNIRRALINDLDLAEYPEVPDDTIEQIIEIKTDTHSIQRIAISSRIEKIIHIPFNYICPCYPSQINVPGSVTLQ